MTSRWKRFLTVSSGFLFLASLAIYAHEFLPASSSAASTGVGGYFLIAFVLGSYVLLGYLSRSPWSVLVAFLPIVISIPDGYHAANDGDILWPTWLTLLMISVAGVPAALLGWLMSDPARYRRRDSKLTAGPSN